MNEKHNRIVKAFESSGIRLTERQKEIAGEAYDNVMKKHNGVCDRCGDVADFYIYNIRKEEMMKYCALHFWKFCNLMSNSFGKMQGAIKEIDGLIRDRR
jgi:Fe2+ or Zn2+ uptake regulation protein